MKNVVALLLTAVVCTNTCVYASGGDVGASAESDVAVADDGEREKILFFTAFIGDFGLSDMGYEAVQNIAETYDMDWTLVEYGAYDAGLAVNSFWDALETTEYDYFFGPS